jgi:hypothetical protein
MNHQLISSSLLLLLFLTVTACNGVKVEDTSPASGASTGGSGGGAGDASIVFSGITSVTDIGDVSVKLNWTAHPAAAVYEVYDVTSGSPHYKTSVMAPATSVVVPGLTAVTVYKFRVRLRNFEGINDLNVTDYSVTTTAVPSSPTILTLVSPTSSPGTKALPHINVAGVVSGNEVKLYTTSNCAPSSEVASGIASGTSIQLTTSALVPGSYTFYATRKNGPTVSNCSTATLSYTLTGCPAGYIFVASNSDVGTNNFFCVMKYEARRGVGDIPQSVSTGNPWVSTDAAAAITACQNINTGGAKNYDLISNPEWMTVARSIEAEAANYNGTAINKGFSDGGGAVLPISDETNPYTDTGKTALTQWNQKRTHKLSGQTDVIWDLSGNAWEWVDWAVETPTNTFTLAPVCPSTGWNEFQTLTATCNNLTPDMVSPHDPTLGSSDNFGKYILDAGRAVTRGGGFVNYGINFVGIYAFHSGNTYSSPATDIGFRCVYRPE